MEVDPEASTSVGADHAGSARDIGQCDDCGSEHGRRVATLRTVTIGGETEQTTAWLCSACDAERHDGARDGS